MNLSVFKSFFKSKSHRGASDSVLLDTMEECCSKSGILLYKDATIYHHAKSFFIPMLLLDLTRGIYICERKSWSYDILKDATIKSSKDQQQADNTLAFDQIRSIIKTKFNELIHNDGVDTFNFLIMENLSSQEYENLSLPLQQLLPKERVFFKDSTKEEIIKKLQSVKEATSPMQDVAQIMGSLLIQYLILCDDGTAHMATKEQMGFIDAKVEGHQVLYGENGSGRTSSVLLKSILYKLQNPTKKVLIISPTTLSCDILKKRLLNIVEHAIIELDLTSITILTPTELIEKHLKKYNKPFVEDYNDGILMKKKMQIAELLICDDSDLLSSDFILYLKHIQSKNNLILITNKSVSSPSFIFKERVFPNLNIEFLKTNPHAKALQLIAKLLKDHDAKDILVVSDERGKEQLDDDLKHFIKDEAVLLDSSKNLIDQNLDNILLVTHGKTSAINAKFVIISNLCETSMDGLIHAVGTAKEGVWILYEDECEEIKNLKERYAKIE